MTIQRRLAGLVLALLLMAAPAMAAGKDQADKEEGGLGPEILTAVEHLVDIAAGKDKDLQPERIVPMLNYVLQDHNPDEVKPERIAGATGAYFECQLKAPLSRILRYTYSRDIPQHLMLPSVIRLSGWQGGLTQDIPAQWDKLVKSSEADALHTVRGVEYEVITPDLTTGAYYRYDMNRAVFLLKNSGRNWVVSVSKQKKVSEVGKKGAIIGPDANWNYFYSGIDGLSASGIGWADSYIYDSFAVNVYYEPEPGKPLTKNSVFKWLRAGWAKMNMVQRHQILEGCRRYAAGFKEVLESPRLPAPDKLAETVKTIKALSDQEQKERLAPYAEAMEQASRTTQSLNRKDFAELIQGGAFVDKMSREEREAVLLQEYIKSRIGKPTLLGKAAPRPDTDG